MALFKASRKDSEGTEAPGSSASSNPSASASPGSSSSSKPAKPAKAPKAPRAPKARTSSGSGAAAAKGPFGAALADIRAKRYPYVLIFSVASWFVVAVTLFLSQVGRPETTIDNASEAAVQGTGGQIAPSAQDQWFVPLLPWFGIVVVIAAVALFVGVGWARLVLAVLGLLMAVGLAEAQEQVPAIVVAVFTVVGAALSLLLPAHRYLSGASPTPAADGPAESDRSTSERSIS